MILQEVNEPMLSLAVSKAATMLGAHDVNITDSLVWDQDYVGRNCKPYQLICFKKWTPQMVKEIVDSALNLKCSLQNTTSRTLDLLSDAKVMILQEVNEPMLSLAVSKAATMLGAHDVNITDSLVWDQDYVGRAFSSMCDVIFVSTATHMCVQRFADQATVPVLCMRSRTHASIQALATITAIIEELGTLKGVTIGYLGPPHPVLNSYLLLCPMLGANIKFKCCCQAKPVSPLLYKASEDMASESGTGLRQCSSKDEVLGESTIIISGPTSKKNKSEFILNTKDVEKYAGCNWIYFHTCPRGDEVDDDLFFHCNSRTFSALQNFQYIAAALMANSIKGHKF